LDDDRQIAPTERQIIASSSSAGGPYLSGVNSETFEIWYEEVGGPRVWRPIAGWNAGQSEPVGGTACTNHRWFRNNATNATVHACFNTSGLLINERWQAPYFPDFFTPLGLGADVDGRSYVAFSTYTERGIWIDRNRDRLVAPNEFVVRERSEPVGGGGPSRAHGTVINGSPVIFDSGFSAGAGLQAERWWPREVTKYLGELCDANVDRCANALECRVSGEAPEPRCVPAVAN
jgi:hypothetical protein